MRSVSRRAVIAYRAAVLGLTGDQPVPTDVLLEAGVQDHPTGATARLALRLRGSDTGGALVHSVRAATHLHHRTDAGVLASALRIEDARELAKQSSGSSLTPRSSRCPSTRPGRAWCGGSCAWPAPASRNGSRPGCP